MEFRILAETLQGVMEAISNLEPKQKEGETIAVTSGVRITTEDDKLFFEVQNSNNYLKVKVDNATVHENGEVVILAKSLAALIKLFASSSTEIIISTDKKSERISIKDADSNSTYHIKTLNVPGPIRPQVNFKDKGFSIKSELLYKLGRKCGKMTGKEEEGIFGAVMMSLETNGNIKAYGTNRNNLCACSAYSENVLEKCQELAIFPNLISVLEKTDLGEDLTIAKNKKYISIFNDKVEFFTGNINGNIPNCNALIDKCNYTNEIVIDKQKVIEAVNRCCSIFVDSKQARYIDLELLKNDKAISLKAQSATGDAYEVIKYETVYGGVPNLRFNAWSFLAALSGLNTDLVNICTETALTPIKIYSDTNTIYLISPIRKIN